MWPLPYGMISAGSLFPSQLVPSIYYLLVQVNRTKSLLFLHILGGSTVHDTARPGVFPARLGTSFQ